MRASGAARVAARTMMGVAIILMRGHFLAMAGPPTRPAAVTHLHVQVEGSSFVRPRVRCPWRSWTSSQGITCPSGGTAKLAAW